FVALTNYGGGNFWNQAGVFATLDQAKAPGGSHRQVMVLQGTLGPLDGYKMLNVEYGLETYYVSEDFARTPARRRFRVDVAVDARGDSAIKSAVLLTEPAAPSPMSMQPATTVIASTGPYRSETALALAVTPQRPPAIPAFDDPVLLTALQGNDPAMKKAA